MTTCSPINETDREMLASAASAAFAKLPDIQHGITPSAIIDAVQNYLDVLFSVSERSQIDDDTPMAFGALFGSTICDAFRWNWVVASHDDWEGLGVVDQEQRYLVLPLAFMDELFNVRGAMDRSPKLIFNCINAPKLPKSSPRKFLLLT